MLNCNNFKDMWAQSNERKVLTNSLKHQTFNNTLHGIGQQNTLMLDAVISLVCLANYFYTVMLIRYLLTVDGYIPYCLFLL